MTQRRIFGLIGAASLLVRIVPAWAAQPTSARTVESKSPMSPPSADSLSDVGEVVALDKVDASGSLLQVVGPKHHAGPTTQPFLKYDWKVHLHLAGSRENNQKQVKTEVPQDGQASVLIDNKGNWQFMGSFPARPLAYQCEVTVGVGLTSKALGKILAFTDTLTLFQDGGHWSKSGHSAIVKDLWKDVYQGHEWTWAARFHIEKPANRMQETHPTGSQVMHTEKQQGKSGGPSASDVGGDLAKALLGPLGWLF